MNKYKDKSSLVVIPDPNDERMGAALSRGLAGTAEFELAQCPRAEEIAAVVEGAAPARVKDRLLKHISTCTDCYESFMLTVELHKQADLERKEDKHKIIFLRPLALAASVLIVVFTAYLVFRTGGIPKTPGDLEKSVTLEESGETRPRLGGTLRREQPAAALESDAERMEKDKKEEIKADNNLDRFSEPSPTQPLPSPSPPPPPENRRMAKSKTFETTKSTAPGSPEPLREVPKEAEETGKGEPALGATAQIQRADDETAGKPSLSYMDRQDSGEIGKKGAPYQQQAIILNQQVREINTYVPQKELDDLFNQTIDLSRQMVKEVEALNKEATASRDFNKMNAYIDGLKPLIKVKVEANAVYIFPDVQWFLSKSDPASAEYRFFSLARSGWCVAGDLCTTGKPGRPEAQKLLAQWQELEPQLTGIFKQIAARTISHLTVEK
ncbi:MAG: hypothetical protein NT166_16110 [Candidatus Aminicenantes bacterium]|nr:hypothetical protein [Candidatus Aminicenantes bacterium]